MERGRSRVSVDGLLNIGCNSPISSNVLTIIKRRRSFLLWSSSICNSFSYHCLNTGSPGIVPRRVHYHFRHRTVSFAPIMSLYTWHQRSSPPQKCPKNTGTSWIRYFSNFASVSPGCKITLS